MTIKHPAVFLFGAGATRGAFANADIPPPLDFDFFDIAAQIKGHGTPILAKRVLRDVFTLYQRTSGVGLEFYYRDLETREKIGQFARTRNKPKDWKRRKKDLEELIRRVMIQTTCDTSSSPHKAIESPIHQKLTKYIFKGDTLVTFNYDTVIEESFLNADLWTPKGGYGDNVHGHGFDWSRKWFNTRNSSTNNKSDILLLKLHGSLNWDLYKNNNQVRIKPRPYVTRTNRGRPVRDKVSILPPGWNKRIDRNPFNELWRVTRLRLEKCKTLVVIGYSLPETDLLARALFNEVVRTRVARGSDLKQLHLVDPSDKSIQKFVDLFVPALGANGIIFRYQNFDQFVSRF